MTDKPNDNVVSIKQPHLDRANAEAEEAAKWMGPMIMEWGDLELRMAIHLASIRLNIPREHTGLYLLSAPGLGEGSTDD